MGGLGWEIACRLSGQREAWDAAAYWQLAYPTFLVTAFFTGWFWPRSAWFTWCAFAGGQVVAMLARNPRGDHALLPFGVMIMLVISVPLLLAAHLGGWWRQRRRRG